MARKEIGNLRAVTTFKTSEIITSVEDSSLKVWEPAEKGAMGTMGTLQVETENVSEMPEFGLGKVEA